LVGFAQEGDRRITIEVRVYSVALSRAEPFRSLNREELGAHRDGARQRRGRRIAPERKGVHLWRGEAAGAAAGPALAVLTPQAGKASAAAADDR
jgi:hypothetical protein